MSPSASSPSLRPLSPFLAWPTFFAAPPFLLQTMLHGLEFSQWEKEATLTRGRHAQLRLLLEWAVRNVPHYRTAPGYASALAAMRRRPGEFDAAWAQLPILTKAELRARGKDLDARDVPPGHGPLETAFTSGSTGIPVEVRTTALARTVWGALTIREHLWHRRDFSKRLGVIRAVAREQQVPGGKDAPNWGPPVAGLYSTGPASMIHASYPLGDLVAWLKRFDPHYVLTYPSVAAALLNELGSERPRSLEEFRLFAEPLDPELEERLAAQWHVRCANAYSANEVGYIAIQCPERRSLHVPAESLFVEVIDESGRACGVGETGRVVLTPLHNLATPLLRYEIGDYATVGAPCGCGRASPAIERVLGRVRNIVRTPEGRRFFPSNMGAISRISGLRQAQFVQTAIDRIELRAVLERPLTDAETEQAVRIVRRVLSHPFEVAIVPVGAIERGPTGKFEEFLSLLPEP